MAKVKGTVKWFDPKRGYGFVVDENGQDYFVHFSSIEKGRNYTGFDDNDEVEFEVDRSDNKGPVAKAVVLTKEERPKKPKFNKKKEEPVRDDKEEEE